MGFLFFYFLMDFVKLKKIFRKIKKFKEEKCLDVDIMENLVVKIDKKILQKEIPYEHGCLKNVLINWSNDEIVPLKIKTINQCLLSLEIIDDEGVEKLFKGMNKLQVFNFVFEKLGLDKERTLKGAIKKIKGIYINIYDFKDGKYLIWKNKYKLLRRCYNRGFYPKNDAKGEG